MHKIYNYLGATICNGICSPESYGAVGDGVHDDTTSFQNALDNSNVIKCEPYSVYRITSTLRIRKDTVLDLNGAKIICSTYHCFFNFREGDSYGAYNGNGNITIKNGYIVGGNISFIHCENITLYNLHMSNSLNDHYIEICATKNYRIIDCSFIGMTYLTPNVLEYISIDTNALYQGFPHNPSGRNTDFYDGTTNDGILIDGCLFNIGEGEYNNGYDAIGAHGRSSEYPNSFIDNITIKNCIIKGFTDCGIKANCMRNLYISNNRIESEGSCIKIGDIVESRNIYILYNYLNSVNGDRIVKGSYSDLTVAYNSIITDNQNI